MAKMTTLIIKRLGTISDVQLAKETGLSYNCVRQYRKKLNIAAKTVWDKKALRMLGKLDDRTVASKLNIARVTVFRKRKELGIKSYR